MVSVLNYRLYLNILYHKILRKSDDDFLNLKYTVIKIYNMYHMFYLRKFHASKKRGKGCIQS